MDLPKQTDLSRPLSAAAGNKQQKAGSAQWSELLFLLCFKACEAVLPSGPGAGMLKVSGVWSQSLGDDSTCPITWAASATVSAGCHPGDPQLPLMKASCVWTWSVLLWRVLKWQGWEVGLCGHLASPRGAGDAIPASLWDLRRISEIYFHSFHHLSSNKKQKKSLLRVLRCLNLHNWNILLDTMTSSIDPGKASITSEESAQNIWIEESLYWL